MAASLQSRKRVGHFEALSVPNFRRFVLGQGISLIGSWTETVAQAILVLQLTDSATSVGFVTAARYLPVLLLTPYAGLFVDRHSKRRILLGTALSLAVLSTIQAVLVLTNTITIGLVYLLALGFGTLSALDNPARQAFIPEMVSKPYLHSAVTLNSTFVNVGRAVGPMVAAGLIATIGIGWCFLANAASFGAVLFALATMALAELHPVPPTKAAVGQLTDGFRYALTVPEIIGPIAMMALIGTFTYEFEVSLPLFARVSLGGTPTTYSWIIGAFGVGSVAGGLYAMWRPAIGLKPLCGIAVFYAAAMLATVFAPNLPWAISLLCLVGFASILFLVTGNSTIQLAAAPEYRGRVMALWSTAFVGSTPVGASIIGMIDAESPRLALGVGAAACMAAAGVGIIISRRHSQTT